MARSFLEQLVRVYRMEDRGSILKAADRIIQAMQAQAQMAQQQAQMGLGGAPGGPGMGQPPGPPGGDPMAELLQALPPQMQALLSGGNGQ